MAWWYIVCTLIGVDEMTLPVLGAARSSILSSLEIIEKG